ncbi:hypothetical protein R3I94_019455 [Phoxinus phoxinus]
MCGFGTSQHERDIFTASAVGKIQGRVCLVFKQNQRDLLTLGLSTRPKRKGQRGPLKASAYRYRDTE